LPAFNTNTKPLKFHALDQLLRILMRAVGPPHDHQYRLGFRAARHSGQLAHGAFEGGGTTLIQLKYPGAGTAVARWGLRLQGVAN
jgi:hypothetical protein